MQIWSRRPLDISDISYVRCVLPVVEAERVIPNLLRILLLSRWKKDVRIMGHRCTWLHSGIGGRSLPPWCLAVIRLRINIGMPRKERCAAGVRIGAGHAPALLFASSAKDSLQPSSDSISTSSAQKEYPQSHIRMACAPPRGSISTLTSDQV